MEKEKETVIKWLSNAYAMEQSLVKVLEQQIKDAEEEGQTNAVDKITEHLERTKKHAGMVKEQAERLGGDVSKAKAVMGRITGMISGKMPSMKDETMVMNGLDAYTSEHMEIAVYTSIRAAALEMDDQELADVCQTILADEEDMADWILDQIPSLSKEYVSAKREPVE